MIFGPRSFGHFRPDRKARLWLAILVAGVLLLVAGLASWSANGSETRFSAAAIGLGLVGSILGAFLGWAFRRTAAEMAALRGGIGVVGRWTLPPATFELFQARERMRGADEEPNGYLLPDTTPAQGIEIIFGEDCLVIDQSYFGLPVAGMSKIRDVELVRANPSFLRFRTSVTSLTPTLTSSAVVNRGELRVPIAPSADYPATRVLDHYTAMLSGRAVARPDQWRTRKRWGLRIAACSTVVGVIGFALEALGIGKGTVAPVLGISGVVMTLGGLVIAAQGWAMAKGPAGARRIR